MKYIMTGHVGLIGTKLKKALDNNGYQFIRGLDKRVSIHDNTTNTKNTKLNADIVFHLADNCKINQIIKNPELSFENVRGIESILEMCRKNNIKKIVYFSSSRVLSKEENPYTAYKKYGEYLVKAYSKCYGIEYIIIRPSTVYGGLDKTNRLMNIWISNALQNEPLEIYGDLNKTLGFTYVDDFVNGVLGALTLKWNSEYNISGKEEKLIDVAREIIKQVNSKSKIVLKPIELEQPQKVNIKSNFDCPTDIKKGIKLELKK